jgi:hypothetical protein
LQVVESERSRQVTVGVDLLLELGDLLLARPIEPAPVMNHIFLSVMYSTSFVVHEIASELPEV